MANNTPVATPTTYKGLLQKGNDIALGAVIAEMLGAFLLTSAVLNTIRQNPMSGEYFVDIVAYTVAMLAVVLLFTKLSGGHANPAITVAYCVMRKISATRALVYVVAQFIGAMLAVVIMSRLLAIKGGTLATLTANGDWAIVLAEFVGVLALGFGVAAILHSKKQGLEAAFTIGGALLVGLILAMSGSAAILNPAVALATGVLDTKNLWGTFGYTLAPVIGATLGVLLYKLLQSELFRAKNETTTDAESPTAS